MTSDKPKARHVLVSAVREHVLPQLVTRGFQELPKPKEPIPMWHLHRHRGDGGFDVISIIFDKNRRPEFYAAINTISADGLRQPWGEFVEANQATAFAPLKRVLLLKKRSGVLAVVLSRWFSHGWFAYRPNDNKEANQAAALHVCEQFVGCLDQAERWWNSRELGPNLVSTDLGLRVNPAIVTKADC